MSLTPGTRLGVYEITAPPGEGGMGQVWRACATKLDRDVAIKVVYALLGWVIVQLLWILFARTK